MKYVLTVLLLFLPFRALADDKSAQYCLVFGANFCEPCHLMEQNVWPNSEIVGVLRQFKSGKAYHLSFERDKEQFRQWKVGYLPCIIIYDGKTGKELRRTTGYKTVPQLKEFLLREPTEKPSGLLVIEHSGDYIEVK